MSVQKPRAIHVVEDRWTTIRHIVEALAIVAAGLWAFYTFVYQEKIKPSSEPAAISNAVSVHRIGRDRTREVLSVSTTLQNTGKTEIDVAASALDVYGDRYESRAREQRADGATSRSYSYDLPLRSRRLIEAYVRLNNAAVGGERNSHIIIEPGASITASDVIVIPRDAYDTIHVENEVVPVKTTIGAKVTVAIAGNRTRGYRVSAAPTTIGIYEDRALTDFSLVP